MSGGFSINEKIIDVDEKGYIINNEILGLEENDNSASGDDFDHDIRLRQDVRGKLTLGRSPKVKRKGKGMAKVDQLKKRGVVTGKKGQINMKRTFKTRISPKEVDIGGPPNAECTSDEEEEELSGRNPNSKSYDEKIEDHMKRAAFVKTFTEDLTPSNYFGNAVYSGWLN